MASYKINFFVILPNSGFSSKMNTQKSSGHELQNTVMIHCINKSYMYELGFNIHFCYIY